MHQQSAVDLFFFTFIYAKSIVPNWFPCFICIMNTLRVDRVKSWVFGLKYFMTKVKHLYSVFTVAESD